MGMVNRPWWCVKVGGMRRQLQSGDSYRRRSHLSCSRGCRWGFRRHDLPGFLWGGLDAVRRFRRGGHICFFAEGRAGLIASPSRPPMACQGLSTRVEQYALPPETSLLTGGPYTGHSGTTTATMRPLSPVSRTSSGRICISIVPLTELFAL